jgi:predicted HTH domain antitoxin
VSTLNLELPRDAVEMLGADDSERQKVLRLELAIALYASGKLPPGHAAELAGMGRWAFGDLMKARGIATPYTAEMIEEDLSNGGRN